MTMEKRTTTMVMVVVTVVMVSLLHVEIARAESCGRRVKYLNANSDMELLTSPTYPHDYENNEHCQWIVSAAVPSHVVQIERMATDLVNWDEGDCEDYLAVYDGLDNTKPLLSKWCDKEKAVIKSSGQSVLIVFHTDTHLTSRGFALKFYSMEKYSSKCDTEQTVSLETSFNPIFVDLPNFTRMQGITPERVHCRYLFTSGQEDAGLMLRLQLHSSMPCEDGNFTIYDGASESSPMIVSWCYGTDPFEIIATSSPQALVTFTLLRPGLSWHVLRLRAMTRSRKTGCSESSIPTVTVSSEPLYVAFPYTTSIQGSAPCSLRLWAKGRFQTLRLEMVNSTKAGIECGDGGIDFFDGYNKKEGEEPIGRACDKLTVHTSSHNMLISPGEAFPSDKIVLFRVLALDYPCNNDTERRRTKSDSIETLPSLARNGTGYPNDAHCRYLFSASRATDSVEVEVAGKMVQRGATTCEGDHITFYDGETTAARELRKWCGATTRRSKVTSSGRHLLVVVNSDSHDNTYEGFDMKYYSVPATGRCPRRAELRVNGSRQRLTSPNYPFYYPINTYCEWLLTAPEGEVVVVKVIKSELAGDCSDMVRVYDGSKKSQVDALGRWCGVEAPSYMSTGRQLLLIFTADDTWNSGGFELEFSVNTAAAASMSVWAIVGGLFAALVIIALVVAAVVLYMRHWRREQHKI